MHISSGISNCGVLGVCLPSIELNKAVKLYSARCLAKLKSLLHVQQKPTLLSKLQ